MKRIVDSRRPGAAGRILAALALAAMAGCSMPEAPLAPGEPHDPFEAENRRTHAFNRELDAALIRPLGTGYSRAMPDDIEAAVGRFADHLSLPQAVINSILQGNMRGATTDTYRFLVNTTVGLGGIFDPATELGMPRATDTDFGETLHVWGVPQGAYLELPVLGPSTERAAAGMVVDLFTDPLDHVLPEPERYYGTGLKVLDGLGQRGRLADTIDSVLYDSADSYAASRSLYLQNRRFKLGNRGSDDYLDPYDTVYDDPQEAENAE